MTALHRQTAGGAVWIISSPLPFESNTLPRINNKEIRILASLGGVYHGFKRNYLFCNDVTAGMIKDAVDSGAKTLEDVQAATGAGTVCGGCLDNIQAIIDELTS